MVAVAIVVILSVILIAPGPAPPVVTITGLGYEWDNPASTLCQVFSIGSPQIPFNENASSSFNVSWYVICETNQSVPNSTVYSINSVSVVEGIPFTVLSSNVPVTVGYLSYSWFNVTLRAPANVWSGQLFLFITATAG